MTQHDQKYDDQSILHQILYVLSFSSDRKKRLFSEAVHAVQKTNFDTIMLVKHWNLAAVFCFVLFCFFFFSENGFLFYQGDMILDCELYETLHPGKRCKQGDGTITRTKRNAVKERKLLWTSRVIPYDVPAHMCEWSISLNLFPLSINCFQTVRVTSKYEIHSFISTDTAKLSQECYNLSYKLDRDFQEPLISSRF